MTLIKNFSDFLLEKSLNEEEDSSGWIFPLEYKSLVTDKDRSISEESFMKIIGNLDDGKGGDLVSGEWEILYQFAKKISVRKDSQIEKDLGIVINKEGQSEYNKEVSKIIEGNKEFKTVFGETIGEKSIKDFSKDGNNRNNILKFYTTLNSNYKKDGDSFYESVKSLYGEEEAKKIKDKEGENIGEIIPKMIGISKISEEKYQYLETQYLTGKEGEKAKADAAAEAAKDLGAVNQKKTRVLLQRIIYCITSSYGCLSQINSMTYIDAGEDRAKKDELLGKYDETGKVTQEGSIYTSLEELNKKITELIGEEGEGEDEKEVEIPKSEFKDEGETLKSKIYGLRDKIKELQEISDNGEMTQDQWEEYVKDKKRPGFRYQDLKDAFGLLQSAVDNYCTGENSSNALDLYYKTLEDYIAGGE